jgi:myosin heavy subunit
METFVDSLVYGRCPKRSWIIGKLESWDAKKNAGVVRATNDGGDALTCLAADIHPLREGGMTEDVDDLLMLTELHDATLLHCIKRRYMRDVIYTNIGAITVALNPFNFKIPRYMDTAMPGYLAEGEVIEKSLPHSWACAHNTYYEMKRERQNQCILVSGESGAGKTEASKIVMKYLAAVSCLRGEDKTRKAAMDVGVKINNSSPALEAFGNAKTVRNDNSSRFGKFMRVKFDEEGFLVGAHITKYLLEKSRIVTASPGERIYHSFYLLIRSKDKDKYLLDQDKTYKSLNSGQTLNNPEYNTADEFAEVCQSMETMGIPADQVVGLWRAVAGILHFENIEFVADGEGSRPSPNSATFIEKGCKMWGVDPAIYEQELRENVLLIMGNKVKRVNNVVMALDARSAVNKAVYDHAFTWLVAQCNRTLDRDDEQSGNFIGLLDIFGFEDFKHNSFEQLCINLTNETLQHHYNSFIFCRDVEECRAEGVDMTDVQFPDNTPCLKMVSGPGGIMPLLDEECQLGSGTDAAFFSKVTSAFASHNFFVVDRLSRTNFVIKHYAGDVSYDTTGFREKNLDTLKDAWKVLLRESSHPLIKELLPAPVETKGPKPTVSSFFRKQLQELMDLINSTSPHWIRCVKPHPAKKPLMFDGISVMNQLSSSGVLGTVKIRKAGFAVRIPKDQFLAGFRIVAAASGAPSTCEGILHCCGYTKSDAQVGTKRVFLRSHIFMDLEARKKKALTTSAKVVQAFAMGVCAYAKATKALFGTNKLLIDDLKKKCRQLIAFQDSEAIARKKILTESLVGIRNLLQKEKRESQDVLRYEEERKAAIRKALFEEHTAQQQTVIEDEEDARADFLHALDYYFSDLRLRYDAGARAARERQARREHIECEKALMAERKQACEQRRQADRQRMFDLCSKRMEPTVAREDKTIRSLQRIQQQKESELSEMTKRADRELERERAVIKRREERAKQLEELSERNRQRRLQTAQNVASREAAFERYNRIKREDFEWQKLERQIQKGQQLALEEARRAFLREKAESDKQRRKLFEEEESKVRLQKRRELEEKRRRDEEQERVRLENKKLDEQKILSQEQKRRDLLSEVEREKAVERSIAWDNDRRERIMLQRPDLSKDDVDQLELCSRLSAPAPFIMTNNVPSYTKVWTPFELIRFDVAPSSDLGQGTPFTVSWVCSKIPPAARVLVHSASGELASHRVTKAVGEARFASPAEWFSGLQISLVSGDKILREFTISSGSKS